MWHMTFDTWHSKCHDIPWHFTFDIDTTWHLTFDIQNAMTFDVRHLYDIWNLTFDIWHKWRYWQHKHWYLWYCHNPIALSLMDSVVILAIWLCSVARTFAICIYDMLAHLKTVFFCLLPSKNGSPHPHPPIESLLSPIFSDKDFWIGRDQSPPPPFNQK